jgi:hypothetical protein
MKKDYGFGFKTKRGENKRGLTQLWKCGSSQG